MNAALSGEARKLREASDSTGKESVLGEIK